MADNLQTFRDLLVEEIDRQENLQSVFMAQREAAAAGNAERLRQTAEAIEALARESHKAQRQRREAREAIALAHGLDAEETEDWIRRLDEPWRSQLKGLQRDLRDSTARTRALLRMQGRLVRNSLNAMEFSLRQLAPEDAGQGAAYTASGEDSAKPDGPSRLDQRG